MTLRPDTADALRAAVARAQSDSRLPSVVAAVVPEGAPMWSWERGVCVDGQDLAPGPAVQYRIGSITKTMTAVLVMQCRDDGLLSLDDRVDRVLGRMPLGDRTVRELLTHTSGLRAEPVGDWWERSPGVDAATLLSRLGADDAVLARGRQHHYSNLAYALLGEIVARVRASPWSQVLRERVLGPLGMQSTTYFPRAPHARGYSVHPWTGRLDEEPAHDAGAMAPAGQLWSTVEDLSTFARFWIAPDPAVLDPDTVAEMTAPQSADPVERLDGAYGIGVRLQRLDGRVAFGHSGSMPGFLAAMFVDLDQRSAAVALANATTGGIVPLVLDLLRALAERQPLVAPEWVPEPALPGCDELTGLWFWGDSRYEMCVRAGMLHLTAGDGSRSTRLRRTAPDRYQGLDGYFAGETLTVERDAGGAVARLDLATFTFSRSPYRT